MGADVITFGGDSEGSGMPTGGIRVGSLDGTDIGDIVTGGAGVG